MVYNEQGEETINFGKHKGKRVEDVLNAEPSYYSWMMQGDFPLYTKRKLEEIYTRWNDKKAAERQAKMLPTAKACCTGPRMPTPRSTKADYPKARISQKPDNNKPISSPSLLKRKTNRPSLLTRICWLLALKFKKGL
jgi:DNA polymerase-3 subunit epsilon